MLVKGPSSNLLPCWIPVASDAFAPRSMSSVPCKELSSFTRSRSCSGAARDSSTVNSSHLSAEPKRSKSVTLDTDFGRCHMPFYARFYRDRRRRISCCKKSPLFGYVLTPLTNALFCRNQTRRDIAAQQSPFRLLRSTHKFGLRPTWLSVSQPMEFESNVGQLGIPTAEFLFDFQY